MEIEVSGSTYRIDQIPAMQQFHIARRLAPALWALGEAAKNVAETTDKKGEEESSELDSLLAMKPVAEAIAEMNDADAEYVVSKCMDAVYRKETTGWMKVQNRPGVYQYSDIDLPVMMQLVTNVIKANLGNFFNALPTKN